MRPAAREAGAAFAAVWRGIFADPAALLLLFVAGIVYSFFYPLPYSRETVQRVPVAVVDQDRSALSRQVIRYAQAHPSLAVAAITSDPREAQALLWHGEVAGVLILPAGLQGQVLAGRRAEAELAGNGVYMMLNKVALNGLAEVVGTVSAGIELKRLAAVTPSAVQALEQRQPVALNAVALFNVREGYGAYIVPAVAVLIVQQTLWLGISLMFGTWRERGGFPFARSAASYLGVWAAFTSVALLNLAYYLGFVMWWQGYPRGGNPGGLIFFSLLFAGVIAAMGVALGTLFRTRERGMQLLLFTALPMVFLSGISWPVEALPDLLQSARWALPSTAGIQGLIALNQLGARLSEVQAEALALGLLGGGAVGLGLWRWRQGQAEPFGGGS